MLAPKRHGELPLVSLLLQYSTLISNVIVEIDKREQVNVQLIYDPNEIDAPTLIVPADKLPKINGQLNSDNPATGPSVDLSSLTFNPQNNRYDVDEDEFNTIVGVYTNGHAFQLEKPEEFFFIASDGNAYIFNRQKWNFYPLFAENQFVATNGGSKEDCSCKSCYNQELNGGQVQSDQSGH